MPGWFVGELDYEDFDKWELQLVLHRFCRGREGYSRMFNIFIFISRPLGAENYYDCADESLIG